MAPDAVKVSFEPAQTVAAVSETLNPVVNIALVVNVVVACAKQPAFTPLDNVPLIV